MAVIKTGLACRLCYNNSGNQTIVHIMAKEGTGFECEGGHKFIDNEELMASNPVRVQLPKQPEKVQPGTIEFKIMITSQLRDRLQERFGAKLNSSIGALLSVLLDGDAFVVSGVEQVNISNILGKEVRNSIELSAHAGQLKVERDEARKEADELKKKTGGKTLVDGGFLVKFDEKISNAVRDRAQQSGVSIPEYLSSAYAMMINNGWL